MTEVLNEQGRASWLSAIWAARYRTPASFTSGWIYVLGDGVADGMALAPKQVQSQTVNAQDWLIRA